jgi:hypothetical protein
MYGHWNGLFCLIIVLEDDFDEAEARLLMSRNMAFETMWAILSMSLENYSGDQISRGMDERFCDKQILI